MYKVKVELTKEEFRVILLMSSLMMYDLHQEQRNKKIAKALHTKLLDTKPYIPSEKKQQATQKATKVRSDRAKEKIQNAINLLQLENKAITHYSISQASGVSFNTVKKHIPELDIIGKL